MVESPKRLIEKRIAKAYIKVNGNRPWDFKVHNEKVYSRILSEGSIGLGESYMDGWWDSKNIDQFFDKLLKAQLEKTVKLSTIIVPVLKSKIINAQSPKRSLKVAEEHYDLGNNLYEKMLDKHMQYTCAYWKDAKTLEEAQINKLELVCKKLGLKPGMKVVEFGGGFGGLAYYMAKHYKCNVTSYNISKEQIKYGKKLCKGLPVKFVKADYRTAKGNFDRVVSIGLCEHVGHKNFRTFMETADKCLKDEGLFLLHTIGSIRSVTAIDPWLDKYIFPGAMLPSIKQLSEAAENIFVIEDVHNFGADYDKTLMVWYDNFNKAWPELKKNYDDRFYRMWKYYLLVCAGSFRCRKNQLWQIVFSKGSLQGVYQAVR